MQGKKMENRIEILRKYIGNNIPSIEYTEERLGIYTHIYAVSQFCAMIAAKRKQNVELSVIAGMLHDIYAFKTLDPKDHAEKGSIIAKEILDMLKLTTDEETEIICTAINKHSDKKNKHSDFTEVLVDADVLQHYLYNIFLPVSEREKDRLKKLLKEFGLE